MESVNDIRRMAEKLSLPELEEKMEGFRRVCDMSMLTEQWTRHEEVRSKWQIYWKVYKKKGGTRD